MSGFTHLHVHTQYSLLDGESRINELVDKAASLGMDALAITDHGAMYGVIDFYKACCSKHIKPIIGMEAYVAPHSLSDREGVREYAHLILLCKNETGYRNLITLSSTAFIEGFYYKPRIDYDLLEAHHEGLICLSACLAGDIPSYLLQGRDTDARKLALRLQRVFKEDFYIELQNHGLIEQQTVLPKLDALAKSLGIKTVATNDIHYVNKEDAEAQDVLLCIQTQRSVQDVSRMRMEAEEFYLKSEAEMRQMLYAYQDAIENSAEIAEKCNLEFHFGERHMPNFTAPDGMDNIAYLKLLCEKGLAKKIPQADENVRARMLYEIDVIKSMGFVDYFLIVWDFVDFAHRKGIFVGPGRGSGAGSLVAYALDITDIDPIKYDLIFERFLNPERISMPDFDIDFCIERRQEVIDYVIAKYGEDHVSQIITFGSLAARQAVKDVGRALGMSYGDVDKIAKLIPNAIGITLQKALEISSELKLQYEKEPQVKKLIDLSMKLEGLPRHASTHAAGVVICKDPITDYIPLQTNDGAVTTQFTKDTVEELGLLKMDFLGLRTLTVIRDTLEAIRQGGKEVPDFSTMEYNDPAIFKLIASGDTDGVFQLESAGMRQFMMQLKPDNFEDIIAGISLFRPGPMEQIPRYIAGKAKRKNVTYETEKLRPILDKTYGCMVYQEQVMQIVRDLAGYSWGRSDLVRRAMAKKKHEVMAKERQYFIHGIEENGIITVPGAVRNGVSERSADKIFDEMMDFASYAFNKSHAAAYAVVAYRTAYLKHYYPVEFMTALINSFLGSVDKITEYIYTCKTRNIDVLPPDINKSGAHFTVDGQNIRFGLAAIRNVGETITQSIIENRGKNGAYKSMFDFIDRIDGLNKRSIEGLIKAGCFDSTNSKRSQLLSVCAQALDASVATKKQKENGQLSLFDIAGAEEISASVAIPLPDIPEFDNKTLLAMERESIGIYLSGHPLLSYEKALKSFGATASALSVADGSGDLHDNVKVRIGGIINSMRGKPTRSGNGIMGYGVLEDLTGTIEIAVFPSLYTKYNELLQADKLVIIDGKLNIRDEQENTILVDSVLPLESAAQSQSLYLRFDSKEDERIEKACRILQRFPGNVVVKFHYTDTKKTVMASKEYYINLSGGVLDILNELLGQDNVKVKTNG